MELTGIIRKIDDLGRIVVPKEIRRKIKVNEGDQVEISLSKDGIINIKKYLPLGDKYEMLQDLVDTLSKNLGFKIAITDKEKVIISSFKNNDLVGENINVEAMEYIKNRENFIAKNVKGKEFLIERKELLAVAILPIILETDCVGSICVIPGISKNKFELEDMNIIKFVLEFLKLYM